MTARHDRTAGPFRWIGWLVALALIITACGGDGDADDGGVIGVVPGGETTVAPGDTQVATTDSPATSATPGFKCSADQVCEIDVPLTEIALDEAPTSIALDGDRAWVATPNAETIVEVDLAAGAVIRTIPVGASAVDVRPGAGSLWVITYDFSFEPMLRIDPKDGTTLAAIGDGLNAPMAVDVVDDAAWAIVDGYGRLNRIDLATNEITDEIGGTEFVGGDGEVAIVAGDGALWAINQDIGVVERVDAQGRSIDSVIGDLGYVEEASGDFTDILADGPKALALTDAGLWVLSDVLNPTDEPNVVGSAALFLLNPASGEVTRRIELRVSPSFSRPGVAITEDAAWFISFVDGYPVRLDFDTGRETFVRIPGFAEGVVTDGTSVWFAVESFQGEHAVIGIDIDAAAAATRALDE